MTSRALLLIALLCTAVSAKSANSFLGSSSVGVTGRNVLDVAETDEPINEQLTNACNLPGGIEEFISSSNTSGEVCQLAASVVGRGNRRTYEFELAQAHQHDLSFQVVLQPLEGLATMTFEHCTLATGEACTNQNAWQTQASTEEWSSGNSFIYVVNALQNGQNRVVLESQSIVSTFSLRIEFFRGGIVINGESLTVLTLMKERCCDGEGGPCTGVLPLVGTDAESGICDSAGNHCDNDGHLTHLDLSESNMVCDLAEMQFLAAGLDNLQVLMLNDNDIVGDLSNADVLRHLSSLTSLEILELGNLPGVTGSLPAQCTAPFTNLIHLGISNTAIGGELPSCIVNTVHQLEMSFTQFSGDFPQIEASANLRYLIAETDAESDFRFAGAMPNLENAEHLHYANLKNHMFEGTVALANNMEAVLVSGNQLTEVRVVNAVRLEYLDLSNNLITELPAELQQLPNLQFLHADGNQLTALPSIWSVANLRDFSAANNMIEGSVPVQFSTMAHLRRVDLSNNQISGNLNDFSESIPLHSKLQWFDISDNQITGTLFAPALVRLAVFSSMRDEASTEFDRRSVHVFDVSNNNFFGEVSQELLQAYEEQVLEGAEMLVDLRENELECPDNDILERSNLSAEDIANLGCSTSSGGHAKRAVLGVLCAVIVLGAIAGLAVIYKRRRASNKSGWFRDERSAATAYAMNAETSSRGTAAGGTGNGWFTGKPDSNKEFAAGLDEPTGGNGVWGFLPFMSRSKQPVNQLLGGGGAWGTANEANYGHGGSGMQLPVSGARRDMHVKVQTGGYKQPGGVTSVELASPMSDVSANSLPRNGGGLIDGGDGDDLSDDGAEGGRMRGVFGGGGYSSVPHHQQ